MECRQTRLMLCPYSDYAMGQTVGVRFGGNGRVFTLHHSVQTGSGAHSAPYLRVKLTALHCRGEDCVEPYLHSPTGLSTVLINHNYLYLKHFRGKQSWFILLLNPNFKLFPTFTKNQLRSARGVDHGGSQLQNWPVNLRECLEKSLAVIPNWNEACAVCKAVTPRQIWVSCMPQAMRSCGSVTCHFPPPFDSHF
jgi:hypothetical protein